MHEPWVGVVATDSQSVLDTLQLGDSDPQEEELPVDLDNGGGCAGLSSPRLGRSHRNPIGITEPAACAPPVR